MADVSVIPYGDGAGKKLHKSLMKTDRRALAFVSGDTVKSFTLEAWAKATRIVFEMPAFSGAVVTGIVSIENSDGKEIYASAAGAEDDTHIYSPDPAIPIVGSNTVKVTLNTDPLSSGTCYVAIYLEGGV
jgi:hypothetical protein